jgi:hypothetical protein
MNLVARHGSSPSFVSGCVADQPSAYTNRWRAQRDGLQPCPPHAWGCPVIMKVDPEHVAWTCGRCGAITLTQDLAVRPA